MRGCLFENVAKIILRRIQKHNYIFLTRQFDSLQQIVDRYKLKINSDMKPTMSFIESNFSKSDILEFKIDEEKVIHKILVYDAKTKYFTIKRDYFEFCKSNFEFLIQLQDIYNITVKVVSITLYKSWSCSVAVKDFDRNNTRVYTYHKKKIRKV
jgi:hypothetical protein